MIPNHKSGWPSARNHPISRDVPSPCPTFAAGCFLEFLRSVSANRNGMCALRRLTAIPSSFCAPIRPKALQLPLYCRITSRTSSFSGMERIAPFRVVIKAAVHLQRSSSHPAALLSDSLCHAQAGSSVNFRRTYRLRPVVSIVSILNPLLSTRMSL